MMFRYLICLCLGLMGLGAEEVDRPVSRTVQNLEGWQVRVDDRLLRESISPEGKVVLRALEVKLHEIRTVMPESIRVKLQAIPIVLDRSYQGLDRMQYHPSAGWLRANGHDPSLERCVHLPRAKDLIEPGVVRFQPWVILHELAHGYHHQVLGDEDARVKRVFASYQASGHGEKVLHSSGRKLRHYALTNHKEFFAEMTESYFGTNDFFPFNRAELQEAEPEVFRVMQEIWGK